jgi:hypothetical protein
VRCGLITNESLIENQSCNLLIPSVNDAAIEVEINRYVKALKLEHYIDERGIWQPRGQAPDCFLRCSKNSIDFAAEKFKEILSVLKANGCEVEFKNVDGRNYIKPTQKVVVTLDLSSTTLRIEEAATRRERPLTASERKEKERKDVTGGWFYIHDRWLYTPTGKPKLVFDYSRQRVIGDDIRPLVISILDVLRESNERKRQQDIERRHNRAKFLLRLRRFRHKLWQERQFDAIEKEAKKWIRAQELRSYIDRVADTNNKHNIEDWLKIAMKLVNDIDPISSQKFGAIVALPKYTEVEMVWHQQRNNFS